jgi:hypothetical protein
MLPLLIAVLFSSAAGPPSQPGNVVQERTFDVGGSDCVFRVAASRLQSGEPNEAVSVECDGRILLRHDLQDADLGNAVFSEGNEGSDPQHERIAVSWERGTGAGLTVFDVGRLALPPGSGPTAKLVFEHFSKCGAEVFEQGDVLFANVGRRFVGSQILPAGTNVYRWKNGKYTFDHAFLWSEDASDSDRYCILMKPARCPAKIEDKPILDPH